MNTEDCASISGSACPSSLHLSRVVSPNATIYFVLPADMGTVVTLGQSGVESAQLTEWLLFAAG